MLGKILQLIRRMFLNNRDFSIDKQIDYNTYDEEIKNKERNLELFHDVVGDNPLKHIDWIIENGLEKFNRLYKSCENGSIRLPHTEKTPKKRQHGYTVRILESLNAFDNYKTIAVDIPSEIELVYDYEIEKYREKHIEGKTLGFRLSLETATAFYNYMNSNDADEIIDSDIDTFNRIIENLERKYPKREPRSNIGMEIGFMPASREQKEMDAILRQCLSAKDCRLYSPANEIKVEVELRGGIGNKVIAKYEETSPYGNIFS